MPLTTDDMLPLPSDPSGATASTGNDGTLTPTERDVAPALDLASTQAP